MIFYWNNSQFNLIFRKKSRDLGRLEQEGMTLCFLLSWPISQKGKIPEERQAFFCCGSVY
jgi:hypothetical protein